MPDVDSGRVLFKTKPFIFISMSSSVSANTCCTTSMRLESCSGAQSAAPIQTVSSVPMANRMVCRPLIFGVFLIIYFADSNIAVISALFHFDSDATGALVGAGAVGVVCGTGKATGASGCAPDCVSVVGNGMC